jgi:hypothetical protein
MIKKVNQEKVWYFASFLKSLNGGLKNGSLNGGLKNGFVNGGIKNG